MGMTLAQLRAEARDRMLDTDSLNYAVDATTLDRTLNAAYRTVKGLQDDRPKLLKASETGLTFAQGDLSRTMTLTTIRRILELYPTNSDSVLVPNGKPLERVDEWELRAAQFDLPTLGAPTAYSTWRVGADPASGVVGATAVGLWPVPDGAKRYAISAIVEPTELSAVGDVADLDDVDSLAVAWIAAAALCAGIGRSPDFIAAIEKRIPDNLQAGLAQIQRELISARDVEKR